MVGIDSNPAFGRNSSVQPPAALTFNENKQISASWRFYGVTFSNWKLVGKRFYVYWTTFGGLFTILG